MDDRDPYWARPWPSAAALAAQLLQAPQLVRGRAVAELGAGLGLAGLAAALAGGTLNATPTVRCAFSSVISIPCGSGGAAAGAPQLVRRRTVAGRPTCF